MENMEGLMLDTAGEVPMVEVPKTEVKTKSKKTNVSAPKEEEIISCLRKTRVIVRFLKRGSGIWGDDPKHTLAGGMAEKATRTFVVPTLSSGMYVNVLTNNEKKFLEQFMGLEHDAMSIYRRENNFWDSTNDLGINKVTLHKEDNYLDLSNPEDYIRYKILLANKNIIAPSLKAIQDHNLATYQFVIIEDDEETKVAKGNMTSIMEAYKNYGKIEEDKDKLILIIETITGTKIAPTTKLTVLQTKINELIQANPKTFNKVVEDVYLDTKVLIKNAVTAGIIVLRGNFYYLRDGMNYTPMCEANQEPTFNNAAIYLNSPIHQDIMLAIQAKLNQ